MKAMLFSLLFAIFTPAFATVSTDVTCSGITTTTTSTGRPLDTPATFFGVVTGTGTVSATICIQGSMDNTKFDSVCIVTLSPNAASPAIDSATSVASRYKYYRCSVTAISGTGASVAVTAGVQP